MSRKIQSPIFGDLSLAALAAAFREACGEEGSGRRRKTAVKPASMKREVSFGLV
jgi:hypothetical protein